MKEIAYICVNCKRKVAREEHEDTIAYVVMGTMEFYEPTCSEECAKTVKQRNIANAKKALEKVENAEIEKMVL